MSRVGDYRKRMTRRLRINDELADAILSGNRVNDERLDAVSEFADLVRELGHGPVPRPSAVLQSLFAATPPPPPLAVAATRRMATASRPHVARRPRRGVLALVMSVVAVGAFGAAGVAGALPSSVQRRLADVVERLTPFSIPRPIRRNGTTTPDPVGTVTSGVNSPTTAGSSAGRPIARRSARPIARPSDDRERRRPGGLVDEDDPARLEPLRRHQPAAAAETNSRRRNSVISAIDSSLEKPAA